MFVALSGAVVMLVEYSWRCLLRSEPTTTCRSDPVVQCQRDRGNREQVGPFPRQWQEASSVVRLTEKSMIEKIVKVYKALGAAVVMD